MHPSKSAGKKQLLENANLLIAKTSSFPAACARNIMPGFTRQKEEYRAYWEQINQAFKTMREAEHMSNVNHPKHYKTGKFEVIDVIDDWKLNFNTGNAVKYIARAGKKNPDTEGEDLSKAAWYLNHELKSRFIDFGAEVEFDRKHALEIIKDFVHLSYKDKFHENNHYISRKHDLHEKAVIFLKMWGIDMSEFKTNPNVRDEDLPRGKVDKNWDEYCDLCATTKDWHNGSNECPTNIKGKFHPTNKFKGTGKFQ